MTDRTRAVIAVHLGGVSCDVAALRRICDPRGIPVVEDCAQALGATYHGRSVGASGAVGCYSLNEWKQISCGDGGMVATSDDALAHRLRLAADKAYDRTPSAGSRLPTFLGNNYRMTELQGAVALAQLRKLPRIVARRRAWCARLDAAIAGAPGVLPPRVTDGCEPSWWFYTLRIDPAVLGVDADAFAEALGAEGVRASPHYIGQCVYEAPLFVQHTAFARAGGHAYEGRGYARGLCPEAERILATCIVTPVSEAFTDADADEVGEAISKVACWLTRRTQARPAA
jgi:dTDP-4-amino-4,6-dideoxygalactose transaminase